MLRKFQFWNRKYATKNSVLFHCLKSVHIKVKVHVNFKEIILFLRELFWSTLSKVELTDLILNRTLVTNWLAASEGSTPDHVFQKNLQQKFSFLTRWFCLYDYCLWFMTLIMHQLFHILKFLIIKFTFSRM